MEVTRAGKGERGLRGKGAVWSPGFETEAFAWSGAAWVPSGRSPSGCKEGPLPPTGVVREARMARRLWRLFNWVDCEVSDGSRHWLLSNPYFLEAVSSLPLLLEVERCID